MPAFSHACSGIIQSVLEVSSGFPVESPPVLVPWDCTESALLDLLPDRPRYVTTGYYTLPVVSLGGLAHTLGLHFEPRDSGRLSELEFFGLPTTDLAVSYKTWQEHLEASFGEPPVHRPGDEGFEYCEWHVGHVVVRHFVLYRFGPEEHVRMYRR